MYKALMTLGVVWFGVLLSPQRAEAFCGFYVSGGNQQLAADATQVVLMRNGTRTVLSMQNNYKGPAEAFAMVIPVPVVLKEQDVKTLPKEVFASIERMGAPRLVEYWEQDPCAPIRDYDLMAAPTSVAKSAPMRASAPSPDLGVTVEAQFTVGEYQIVILSAKDSTGLDTWLRREKYSIPPGAEPLLRPYVESDSKFFVAKVDPKKVKFVDGRADLSPIRFHYDTDQFTLPIRLGLANSTGTQDLIVSILAPAQRYEVANYRNVTIPTNLDVESSVRDRFGAFYASLFDRTLEKNPGAVVTEYAWQATNCDPCPGPVISVAELMTLGGDVIDGGGAQMAAPAPTSPMPSTSSPPGSRPSPAPRPMPSRPMPMRRGMPNNGWGMDYVLTRLHARYGKEIQDDLVFKAAPPIVGGREFLQASGQLEERSQPSSINNFQGRYAIRNKWTGKISCANPRRNIWGGPPSGGAKPTQSALGLAFAPRGQVQLGRSIRGDVPEIGLRKGKLLPLPRAGLKGHGAGPAKTQTPPAPAKKP
jgi:hypothetical protein